MLSTPMSDLQPLSKDEQEQSPYDIRSWEHSTEIPEQRITTLHALIQDGRASMVVLANTAPRRTWTVYMASTCVATINECAGKELFDWEEVLMEKAFKLAVRKPCRSGV
jgi:hypothetical protein